MGAHLYILLPVHNRRAITVNFVEALARQTYREFTLILIDDGSLDGTADAVRKIFPEVVVLIGTGNWWWAGCLDQGCRYLEKNGIRDDDILALLNDDVVVSAEFIADALGEFLEMRDVLLLARQRDADSGREIDQGGGVRVDLREMRFAAAARPEEINCLPTRGLFLRWRDMKRAGGFIPQALPHYLSDYEFTLRAARKGLNLRVARKASIGVRMDQSGRSLSDLFAEPRARRILLIFSRRYKDNPVTWSVFVWFVASPTRKLYLWLKIWFHFLVVAVRSLVTPIKRAKNL